jgi:hypothetical protein
MENTAPKWFDENKITRTFDAREMLADGGHPVAQVLEEISTFDSGDIYQLVTPFLPQPLLDKVNAQGFECWTKIEDETAFRNYFYKL